MDANRSIRMEDCAPAPGKSCGSCTLCCKVLGITALQKPTGIWCSHCAVGKGCSVYSDRPDECRKFFCLWLVDSQMQAEWKPDRSKIVIVPSSSNGLEIHCDPGYPLAWRREPYWEQIQQWAHLARQNDSRVIIVVGRRMTVIAPEGEFPLGEVFDDDRIAYEYAGSQLTGVRVVKAKNQ